MNSMVQLWNSQRKHCAASSSAKVIESAHFQCGSNDCEAMCNHLFVHCAKTPEFWAPLVSETLLHCRATIRQKSRNPEASTFHPPGLGRTRSTSGCPTFHISFRRNLGNRLDPCRCSRDLRTVLPPIISETPICAASADNRAISMITAWAYALSPHR